MNFAKPEDILGPQYEKSGSEPSAQVDAIVSGKPQLGLIPKRIRQQQRFLEVCEAIKRYWDAGEKIPLEWIEEYNELIELCR